MQKYTSQQLAWLIRRHAVEMTHLSHGGHLGSILSVADIIAVLYADVMKYRPKEPEWKDRDRFILSKGHAGAAIYAALAEEGFFPVEELKTHYADGSRLSGHVSHYLPGVDFSTGSLGHGLSAGLGMAYASKKSGDNGHKVYAVLGDGECNEGAVWEAALFANHFRVDNLVVIVDHNHMQSLDFVENTLELADFGEKWSAFGWNVIEIDGHSHSELKNAFINATRKHDVPKPTVIIANTVKGCGISFMENRILWHYRYPHSGAEYILAVNELHNIKPEGIEDIYIPDDLPVPENAEDNLDLSDWNFTSTWSPSYPEEMHRRVLE